MDRCRIGSIEQVIVHEKDGFVAVPARCVIDVRLGPARPEASERAAARGRGGRRIRQQGAEGSCDADPVPRDGAAGLRKPALSGTGDQRGTRRVGSASREISARYDDNLKVAVGLFIVPATVVVEADNRCISLTENTAREDTRPTIGSTPFVAGSIAAYWPERDFSGEEPLRQPGEFYLAVRGLCRGCPGVDVEDSLVRVHLDNRP